MYDKLRRFADRGHKLEIHIFPIDFANFDGRLKRHRDEQITFKSDISQKDGPMSPYLRPSRLPKVDFWRPIAHSWFSKICFLLERGAHFCKNMKTKCIRVKISSKSHLANCICDANSYQVLGGIICLQLARHMPSEMKTTKMREALVGKNVIGKVR